VRRINAVPLEFQGVGCCRSADSLVGLFKTVFATPLGAGDVGMTGGQCLYAVDARPVVNVEILVTHCNRFRCVTQFTTLSHGDQAQGAASVALAGRSRAVACLSICLVLRFRRTVFHLQEASHIGKANALGFRLYPLRGNRAGMWIFCALGTWRMIFPYRVAHN